MNSAAGDIVVRALGWYLLHSLWFGAAVAIAYALFERAASALDPRLRYVVACLSLVSILMVPVPLAVLELRESPQAPPSGEYWRVEQRPATGGPSSTAAPTTVRVWSTKLAVWQGRARSATPALVGIWLGGALLMAIRYALLWRTVRRLCLLEAQEAPSPLCELLESVRLRLGVERTVRLLVSARIQVPMVLGWARVVVVLPLSLTLGMPRDHLEAILAHELAHVRRHDWAVNLLQVFASTVLFHHPAIWWLGGRITAEREFCCDDLAANASGGRLRYLRALVHLEELRADESFAGLALSAAGGDIMARARRLIGEKAQSSQGASASLVVLGLLSFTVAGWLALTIPPALAQQAAAREIQSLRERNRAIASRLADETERRLETPITLHLADAPLRNVLQAIGREARVQIVYPLDEGLRSTDVDAKDEPARAVLDKILEDLELVWISRGDLAVQVLPIDGSIPASHKLLRFACYAREATSNEELHGIDSIQSVERQFMEAKPSFLSDDEFTAAREALAALRSTMPPTTDARRLIVQVQRAPETESNAALQLEITCMELEADAASHWAALASIDPSLNHLLASPPRLLLNPHPAPGSPREFSLILPLTTN